MARLVIDASVTVAAFVPEEHSTQAREILRKLARQGGIVPGLWALEIAHVLLMLQRRRIITGETRLEIIGALGELPIAIDPETAGRSVREISEVAARHELTVYDAAYLELALRLSLPLATFDAALRRAAVEAGVELV